MKKFLVEMKIITEQRVVYEIESESLEKLNEELDNWSPADLGHCVEEQEPEYYDEHITEITEKKGAKNESV